MFTDSRDFFVSFVVIATPLGTNETGMALNNVLCSTQLLSHWYTLPIPVWMSLIIVKRTHKRKYLQKSNSHSACQSGYARVQMTKKSVYMQ